MSAVRPPLPPRQHAPPPPPRPPSESEDEAIPRSIAARIASLKLGQVGGSAKTPPVRAKPPPIPARRQGTTAAQESAVQNASKVGETAELLNSRSPPVWTRLGAEELARALARRPPPPPPKRFPVSDVHTLLRVPPSPPEATLSQRRLPPMIPFQTYPQPPCKHPDFDAITPGDESYSKPGSCPECRDFAHVDAHAALFPRHTVTSLDDLAYSLTEPFPYELEKARAIFTWLHHNITYDAEAFFSGNVQPSTAESTLSSGLAVKVPQSLMISTNSIYGRPLSNHQPKLFKGELALYSIFLNAANTCPRANWTTMSIWFLWAMNKCHWRSMQKVAGVQTYIFLGGLERYPYSTSLL
ncbi:hypothetical protein C0992_009385 [Termitomyces sp. T32_za158]|nr:hypothetical protein C0992_009385 [Termitomyces sp. T32_za158]